MSHIDIKISVVTVCRNAQATICGTLTSVKGQSYGNVEHVIVDGASTDNTLEVVRCEASPGAVVISEADRGVYDAMNKGLRKCSGDYVLFLNADDQLIDADVLADFVKCIGQTAHWGLVYGNVVKTDGTGRQLGFWGKQYTARDVIMRDQPPHQACFFQRKLLEQIGGYRTGLRVAGDVDLIVRVLKAGPSLYVDRSVALYSVYGLSSRPKEILVSTAERVGIVRREFGLVYAMPTVALGGFAALRALARGALT